MRGQVKRLCRFFRQSASHARLSSFPRRGHVSPAFSLGLLREHDRTFPSKEVCSQNHSIFRTSLSTRSARGGGRRTKPRASHSDWPSVRHHSRKLLTASPFSASS